MTRIKIGSICVIRGYFDLDNRLLNIRNKSYTPIN